MSEKSDNMRVELHTLIADADWCITDLDVNRPGWRLGRIVQELLTNVARHAPFEANRSANRVVSFAAPCLAQRVPECHITGRC